MNSKQIFVLFALFVFIGCSSESKSLSISPSSVKFNDVNIGDSREIDVVLKNKYGKDLIISTFSLSGSNDFSITAGGSVPLNFLKNTSHTLKVRFEPTSTGVLAGLISILHDASNNPVEVELSGNGIPVARAVFSENNHDFKKTKNNTTRDYDFEVDNIGTADLIISNFTFTGVGASVYSISAGGNVPVTIIPGITHTFTVSFEPTADGQYPSVLQVSHNAVNENSPFEITLAGEGITAAPEISLSQTSPWDLGETASGRSSINDLEITNSGLTELTVTSITFTSGTEFTLDSIEDSNGNPVNLPQIIAVSEKIIAKIKFQPPAIATYNDTMSIIHDGINVGTPLDVELTGKGRSLIVKTFSYTGAIENWTIPAGVTQLTIEVWGAKGGDVSLLSRPGGKGARMRGDFVVSPSDSLKILVGGAAPNVQYVSGGGGGTFVCESNDDPLIIAGGGGGTIYQVAAHSGIDATTSTTGNSGFNGTPGGSNGNGGSSTRGGGGGGLLTDGKNDSRRPNTNGKAFVNDGAGGNNSGDPNTGGGGFGGGGAAIRVNNSITDQGAGGGGGYSGGGGAGSTNNSHGGGGGSYNGGTNPSNTAGTNNAAGKVEISY